MKQVNKQQQLQREYEFMEKKIILLRTNIWLGSGCFIHFIVASSST